MHTTNQNINVNYIFNKNIHPYRINQNMALRVIVITNKVYFIQYLVVVIVFIFQIYIICLFVTWP